MSKSELVELVATETGSTKTEVEKIITATLKGIEGSLKKGKDVTFVGFGSFKVSKRAARTGRNPQTGADIKIPARNAVSFKVGSKLKEAVN